jgi:hypothetical protein
MITGQFERNELIGKAKEMRLQVVLHGHQTRCKKPIPNDFVFGVPLCFQVVRDMTTGYKFYDALGMWLDSSEFWSTGDIKELVEIAEKYIKGEL